MTQSGTDKDAEETVEKQGIELLLIYLFITVLIMNDDISQKDANRPQQSVITDGESEKIEQFGTWVPIDR